MKTRDHVINEIAHKAYIVRKTALEMGYMAGERGAHFTPCELNEANVQAIFQRCLPVPGCPEVSCELFPPVLGYSYFNSCKCSCQPFLGIFFIFFGFLLQNWDNCVNIALTEAII